MPSPGTLQALTLVQARELEKAHQLLRTRRADAALEIAGRLVAQAAQSPDAHQLLALCHAEKGDAQAAEQGFLRALEFAPDHPLVLSNYGTMLRKAGRPDAALVVLQRAVDAAPDSAKAWTELGITAFAARHHQQAITALERALSLQPDSVLAWHVLGNASRAAGDLEAAENAFRKVIALVPEHRSAWINLGAVLRLAGRADESIACFERIIRSGDTSPELADATVGVLLDSGKLDEAMQLARRIARDHPDFVPGLVTLANLLWEYGRAQDPDHDPFDMFRAALARRHDNDALRMAFARFLLSARSSEEALDQIRILRSRADQPMLASMEADALEMQGHTEQAGALYARLDREWNDRPPALLNAYARHLLKAGEWDAAASRATEATQADPWNQEAWAYLATAWRLMGDARESWLCDYDRLITMIGIEPPGEFEDQADFLQVLRSTLDPMHQARQEPVQQSLRGGSQTPGRLFGRRNPVIAAARASLLHAVERWLATLPADDRHPFLMRKTRSVRVGGSWSVKLRSSGNHVNHIHPEGWMSSAFYVSLPPSVATPSVEGTQAGHIQFGQPPLELDLGLPPRRVIRPEPGKLALFPSYMWHGTVPFEDAQPRITIAFDMTPLADRE